METPLSSFILGDFNAKCTNWWPNGVDNACGLELFNSSTLHGYSQVISEPTNFQPNSSPSCIDLIFTNQPNLIIESGVQATLSNTCHHQIIYAKISFKIYYPPSYKREVWHYNDAQINSIQDSISNFDWKKAFENLSVNEQVELFTTTLFNIFRNFIPHENLKCNPKDPPWINKNIKKALRRKNRLYRKFMSGGQKIEDEIELSEATNAVSELISTAKESYFVKMGYKLNDPQTSPKTYWAILKRFLNKVKIPEIPPLLVDNVFVTDFKTKTGVFNEFFSNQCNILDNGSILPQFNFRTHSRLTDIAFSPSDLSKIIKDLNPNKSHGHDNFSIRMIQICGDSIIPPLILLFESSIQSGNFPDSWKKGNITPVHKKQSKNLVNNYRPISLLPILGKVFEKLIYNSLYEYLINNQLLSEKQSGFRKGDSCVSQLISITHNIYRAFDCNPSLETRGVFLDISKAFDKVWHKGLLFKLKSYGVEGKAYKLLENYLSNRKQRVLLNGQFSSWLPLNAGVPQGSVLGPLLFLIYINDLSENLTSETKLFADDTSIFSIAFDVNRTAEELNKDLNVIKDWAFQWKMSFNPDPNKQATEVIFSHKKNEVLHPTLYFNQSPVACVLFQKHLGLILDKRLKFDHHLNEKIAKAFKGIGLIKRLYHYLPRNSLLTIYRSYVRPHLDYCDVIYDQPHNATFSRKIETVQYNAALAITGAIKGTSYDRLYQELGLEYLSDRRRCRRLFYFFNIVNFLSPKYLSDMLPGKQRSYNPERAQLFAETFSHSAYFSNSFFPFCIKAWNKLSPGLRNAVSVSEFKNGLLKLYRPEARPIFNIFDPVGLKLLTRLRTNLSHLRDHKFHHNFLDTLNPLCSCNIEIESTSHYLLRCSFFITIRKTLLDNIIELVGPISNLSDEQLVNLLLYGQKSLCFDTNKSILNFTIAYIKASERFDVPLL